MAKKNGTLWTVVTFVSVIALATVVWIWGAATIAGDVKENRGLIDGVVPISTLNKEKIIRLELKLDRLDEKLTEQNTRQQEMLFLQQQILEAVSE